MEIGSDSEERTQSVHLPMTETGVPPEKHLFWAGVLLDESFVLLAGQCLISLCLKPFLTSCCLVSELCSLIRRISLSKSTSSKRPLSSLFHSSSMRGFIPSGFLRNIRRVCGSVVSGACPNPSGQGSWRLFSLIDSVEYGVWWYARKDKLWGVVCDCDSCLGCFPTPNVWPAML